MHFNAQEVTFGRAQRALEQMVAVAEPDLQRQRRRAAEMPMQIQCLRLIVDAIAWPELLQRAALRCRDAASPNDVTAYGPLHAAIIASAVGIVFAMIPGR